MRERLLADVQARVERFGTGQDPAVVLDPTALAEVAALLNTVSDPTADLEVAHAAGWLHWCRYLVLGPGDDQQDLSTALRLLAPVYQVRPDAVPNQVRAHFDADQLASPGDPEVMADRAAGLLQHTLRTGDCGELDRAIDLLRQALDATPPNRPVRVAMLSNLGLALRIRFTRTGRQADLDEAVAVGWDAVAASPPGHPDRAGLLSNFSAALMTRFEQTGRQADLDEAVAVGWDAVAASPPDHPKRAIYLSNFCTALRTRFEQTGRQADLDEAVAVGRDAVAASPPDHPKRAVMLSALGLALCIRFTRTGRQADLDEAVDRLREAVAASPPDHPDRAGYLSNLGAALQGRSEWHALAAHEPRPAPPPAAASMEHPRSAGPPLASQSADSEVEPPEVEPLVGVRRRSHLSAPSEQGGVPSEEPVQIWIKATMDAAVVRDEAVPVTVLLSGRHLRHVARPGEAGGETVADPAVPIIVEAIVRANLELVGVATHQVNVPATDETRAVVFVVRATHLGRGELWIAVRQRSLPLLQPLVLAPTVVSDFSPPVTSAEPRLGLGAEGGFGIPPSALDGHPPQVLRIYEERHGDSVVYRYDLEAHDLQLMAAFASRPIVGDRDAYVRALYRRIENCWLIAQPDREMFAEQLRAFGAELLDELIPVELQRILWENRDRLHDILVLSTEPFIPWELLHLKDSASRRLPAETCFLGQLGLLRWLWGPYPPETIRLRPGRARHIVPTYPPPLELPQARSEQAFLERVVGSTEVLAHHREVLVLLKDGSFDLLHFAGHGRASTDDIADAQVLLAGRYDRQRYVEEPLRVSVVRHNFYRPPMTASSAFGEGGTDRPLVVVNACQIGRMGYQLSTIGGFAEAFVLGGAGAFVGCMWSVGDDPARDFIEEFYRRLLAGETMAAATAAGREAARRAGDATWLAYTVYANPRAHLVLEPIG